MNSSRGGPHAGARDQVVRAEVGVELPLGIEASASESSTKVNWRLN